MEFSRSSHRSLIKKVQLTKSLPEPVPALRKKYKYIAIHLDKKLFEAVRAYGEMSGLAITEVTRAAVNYAIKADMPISPIGSREAVKHSYGSVTYYRNSIAFPAEQRRYLKEAARDSNLPLTEVVRCYLRQYIER